MAKDVALQSGVLPITHDRSRDWSHKTRFGSVSPVKLPDTLGIHRMLVEDQDEPVITQFCTGYGTSKAAGYHYGIDMSPEWQVGKIGEYNSVPIMNGTDPKTAMEAAVLNGFLPKSKALYTLMNKGPEFIADWRNWNASLDPLARGFSPTGYYAVSDEPTDIFDDVRSALYKAKQANDWWPVMAFGKWYSDWNRQANQGSYVISENAGTYSLHNYIFIDWITVQNMPYLVAHLSEGTDWGDRGFCYFSRESVNAAWKDMYNTGTGLYIFRSTGNRNDVFLQIGLYLRTKLAYLLGLSKA